MKLIYQIGRLDFNIEKPIKFKIDNNLLEEKLSSFAVKQYFKEIFSILIYPVSLPFNKKLCHENSDISEELKNDIVSILKNPSGYFHNPQLFFEKHPYTNEADDFMLIHSIGEYENIKFEGDFDDFILEIFLDMIERYLTIPFTEIYVDISSGLNIYISALLEAIKHFSVFSQLLNWENKSKIPKVFIVYSDPIQGSSLTEYVIHRKEITFKAFFSSPIKYEEINNFYLARKIANEDRDIKNEIQNNLETFGIIFSGIKNNIPLSLYYCHKKKHSGIQKDILKYIFITKKVLYENWNKSPHLPITIYIKLFLSIALYIGIIEVLDTNGIETIDEKTGIRLSEIKKKFTSIYNCFGLSLNREWLSHELSNLEKVIIQRGGKLQNEEGSMDWENLSEYFPDKPDERGGLEKRNFLAHCGFEKNIVQIKREKEIFVKWNLNKKETNNIKKYLSHEI